MKESNIFKDKLYNHTMPVRSELWDAIEAQLPPKKERRIFPLFWLILFASTILGGALMIGLANQDTTSESLLNMASHSNAESNAYSNANAPYPSNISADTRANENPSMTAATSDSHNDSSDQETSKSSNQNITTDLLNSSSKNTSSKGTSGANAGRIKSKSPVYQSSNSKANSPGYMKDEILLNESALLPADALETSAFTRNNYASSGIPLADVTITGSSDLFVIHPVVRPDPNCYKFTSSGGQIVFSVDGYIGPGFSPKSYTANANESSAYIAAREATESNQYAWSTGARFNVHHRSGLTGRIGINYTQAGDVFDYTDSLATQSTTRIDSFFAADGTFLYAETSQVLILGTLIKKIHNTYRYLDIPLIIGYEMPMGRSNLMFNVGPVLNLKSSHEGQILDPMLHPRPITDGKPGAIDVYKTSLGLSLYLGAGILFPISDSFSGLVEPSFTYRLSPVTVDNYPISERRHYAGLNVGLRYHIQ